MTLNSALNTQHSALSVSDSEAEQLLHNLVATPSPSYDEAASSHLLVDWMQNHGYNQAYVDESGSAVGVIGQGSREIVLLGHIDTFPGCPPVRRDGRLLYGRGSVDAKGPLCTFASAAARANIPDGWRVVVVGAVEEEAASSKGARHQLTRFQPELCIIGEPSRWERITLGYKGRLLLDWHWEGDLAHSAGQTLSPAEHAVVFWQRIQDYTARHNQGITARFEQISPSLREINTGNDGVYGWAKMTIGLRLPLGIPPDELASQLTPDDGATLRTYSGEHAYAADKDNTLTRALRGAIRTYGGQPRFVYKTGTADMNVVGPVWNCPIVAYGPGDSALDHTPDEHIDLDEYLRAIHILTHVLEQL